MSSAPAAKTQLTITVCSETQGVVSPLSGKDKSVSVLINPAQLKLQRTTVFDGIDTLGDTGQGQKFSRIAPPSLSFSVVLDGTGVVPRPPHLNIPQEVDAQLKALLEIAYAYNGEKHEPNIVQITWGGLIFHGRSTSFVTDYTLFKPNGEALRANVSLSFSAYMSAKEERLSADKSSPDLSHIVEIQAGDTLPLLCHRIYGDSRYYADVARFNKLRQFRNLQPGMRLHFPPLE